MDVLLLSRLQFAFTIMFHYLFPPLTIGMGGVLVWLEARFLRTGDPLYETAARFWTRLFALNFAMGVVTGLVMEFQFGTNWAAYSRFVGDVFGSALAAEGIFAFFLESGFLAVLVFGWDRVGPGLHFLATVMVALGSIFSAVWIVVANSWQQTPAGSHVVMMTRDGKPWILDGEPVLRAEITDFWAMVLNPSSLHRLSHVLIASFIMGAFFVMSISAFYLLKGRHREFARRSFAGGLLLATVSSLAIIVSGHLQAESVARHQPAKLAAFESQFRTGRGDLSLFAIPDEEAERLRFNLAVPGGLGLMLHGDPAAEVMGLDRFRPEDRPPVLVPFTAYHLMVGLGFAFLALTLGTGWMLWRGRLESSRWLLMVWVLAAVPAVVANQAGWVAAEVGRQPWVVHPPLVRDAAGEPVLDPEGFARLETVTFSLPDGSPREVPAGLRTGQGISASVSSGEVLTSLLLFGAIYGLLLVLWIFILHRKIQQGPGESPPPPHGAGELLDAMAARPGHTDALAADDGKG